ncbi:MAG: hypothetical protein HY040_18125 [Planctomycetes bacterium]|nr:hypothetical protein [Planctomycetota bacterium]
MKAAMRPIAQLTEQATEILIREMGIVDALRFLNQFHAGSGDYTKDRGRWLNDLSLAQITPEIKAKSKKPRRTSR